ncbi:MULTISPECIES: hypothetical protein [unclassified Streptomyces]|uniref:hypothetical protein n=1 Tax=unclassified Streptomyces TaxID=2593676 RepID=UPI00382FEF3C
MPPSEPVRLRSESTGPYMVVVFHDPITDRRLSAADLGVYLRCRWLLDVRAPYGDLDWLITELGMPDAETRDSVRRLVDLGYLEMCGADEVEFHGWISTRVQPPAFRRRRRCLATFWRRT